MMVSSRYAFAGVGQTALRWNSGARASCLLVDRWCSRATSFVVMLRVDIGGQTYDVRPGQSIVTKPGETVRYSTPEADGAEYIAVCLPAFSPDTVHRVEE